MPERAGPELTPEQLKEIEEQQRAAQEQFKHDAEALSERIDKDDDLKHISQGNLLLHQKLPVN